MADHAGESLIGRSVGDYRILSPLGTGGMGAVYLAEDMRLRRKVAIKFLTGERAGDERARQRLVHEARAAAALDHPNICTVYDVGDAGGQSFIVMQYVEGQTLAARLLAGPIDVPEALDVASQVAEALAVAHDRGIVHRDVKPQNIMLGAQGPAKVLDFGIAKVTAQRDDETQTASGLATAVGAVAGTVPYMSPEQVRGASTDGRSDLFSFGIVLHEMVMARHPFRSAVPADTMAAILTSDPPPIDRPAGRPATELDRIVRKCLEKDPALRYQSARDLLVDLRRLQRDAAGAGFVSRPGTTSRRRAAQRFALVAAGAAALLVASAEVSRRWASGDVIGSVAVLPLVTVRGAPDLDYQAEGITDSLIDSLSLVPGLKVTARSAVLRYAGQDVDVRAVGQELGVEALVIGRLVGGSEAFSLRLELVDADDSRRIWGEQFDLTPERLLAVQREIPMALSRALRPRLDGAAAVTPTRVTDDPEAYRLYLLGRFSLGKFTQADTDLAIDYFHQALKRDPDYALAYSGLADAYNYSTRIAPAEAHRLARDAATKAITLNPDLSEAHMSLAEVLLNGDWDFAGAEREFLRAIQLNPNNATAFHQYAHFLLAVGRTDDALAANRRLEQVDPVSDLARTHFAYHYLYTRQYDEAISAFLGYMKEGYDPGSHLSLGDAYHQKGMVSEAFEQYLIGHGKLGSTPDEIATLKRAIAERGMAGYLETRIAQLEARGRPEVDRFPMMSLGGQLAALNARLGNRERAFQHLERMYAERDEASVHIREDIAFDSLRGDPRFADLLRRIGLPPL